MAVVMVTAVLLSAAMVGGGMPRMMPVEAVHAVLGTGRATAMTFEVRAVSRPTPDAEIGARGESDGRSGQSGQDRFLAVAPSGPARGDLPPPAA